MGIEIQSRNLSTIQTPTGDSLVQPPRRFAPYPTPNQVASRDALYVSPSARTFFFPHLHLFRTHRADFASFFQGFHTGSDIKISAKGFVGSGTVKGSGKAQSLTSEQMQMDLHITSPFGGGDLNLDLRKEGDSYHLYSPQNWPATVTQKGNTLTVANQTNAGQQITIVLTGAGAVDVDTKGFGYDGKTLVAKATN